jgi:uncharacterized protein YbaA (DUF1428 family)
MLMPLSWQFQLRNGNPIPHSHNYPQRPTFKEFGALRIVECWGDDVPPGKLTSFPMAVKCEPDETVVFSWIEWPSKQARDEGMKKFMTDSRLSKLEMPFDGKRMIFGGFVPIIEV